MRKEELIVSDIRLEKIKNVRDLGGIVNREGKKIREGLFIRSSVLYELSEKDKDTLARVRDLKRVIDLRTDKEMAERPDTRIEGVEYIHVPLLNESVMGITHEEETERYNGHWIPEMPSLYRNFVTKDFAVEGLKRALHIICDHACNTNGISKAPLGTALEAHRVSAPGSADGENANKSDGQRVPASNGSVLWHCTEGKDRCGILSALLLSILDVDNESIMQDYLMTNKVAIAKSRRYYYMILLTKRDKRMAKSVREAYRAERAYLQSAFDAIDERYGSMDAFLKDRLGITDDMKDRLKQCSLTER